MKKAKILIFEAIFTFVLVFFAFAELYSSKLSNGLEVVVIPDDSTPLTNVSYLVKAGFSSQTQKTAGLAKFVSELIFLNSEDENFDFVQNLPENAELICTDDYVLFNFVTTQNRIDDFVQNLSKRLTAPSVKDETLQKVFAEFAKAESENMKTTTFLLNSAIESRIFADSPWKTETGISTDFLNSELETLKKTWVSFFKNFYTPQNSTIFFSGNITVQKAIQLANDFFGTWQKADTFVAVNNQAKTENHNKKYVLVSDDFSADFNQFIIQFTNNGITELQTTATFELAATTLENSFDFKQYLIDAGIGLYDEDYFYSGISKKGASTRVILQSLLDSRSDPVVQANAILCSLDFGNVLQKQDFLNSQNQIIKNMQNLQSSSKEMTAELSENWLYGNKTFFSDYENALLNTELEQAKSVFKNEPYVFVAMNEQVYNEYKKQLQEAGFSVITRENASLFQNIQNQQNAQNLQQTNVTEDNSKIQADLFSANSDSFAEITLQSGVKVFTKKNNFGKKINVRFCILGGESLHEIPGLETIIIQALVENIRLSIFENFPEIAENCAITYKTELYKSTVSITCNHDDLAKILHSVNEALFFGEITSAFADELIFAENYNWRIQKATEQNQLQMAMFQSLFKNSKIEKFFTQGDSLLVSARFTDILNAYTKLLDSSRFVIFASGDIPNDFQKLIEENFSLLKQLTSTNAYSAKNCVEPVFSESKIFVKLQRLFKTSGFLNGTNAKNIPMPLKLIPTTKFEDPAIFCFAALDFNSDDFALFNACMHFFEQCLKEKYKNDLSVSIYNKSSPFVVVEFLKIPENFDIESFFLNELNSLQATILNNAENADKIKHLYTINEFSDDNLLENATKNMEDGFYFGDNSSFSVTKYLLDYSKVQNASLEDFAKSLEFLFEQNENQNLLKVFSK